MELGTEVKGQLIKYGAIIAIVVIILIFIKKKLDQNKLAATAESKVVTAQKRAEVEKGLGVIHSKLLTFPIESYLTFAKSIDGALGGMFTMADGGTVKRIFEGFKNLDDVKALIWKYGIRHSMGLQEAIQKGLPDHALARFSKADLNELLAKKKISFVF